MKNFTKNTDGTVTDFKTGLTWSQTIAKDVNHETALEKIAALGEGWRMPTCDELLTLVDRTKFSPAIDTEVFPDTENDWYWTDTPHMYNPKSAVWVVYFCYGLVSYNHRDLVACVRAVRSSQ